MKHSTLFLDESGKSSLGEKENEPFVLTGVILDDEEISPVEGFFNYIKRKYKINPNEPFHSYDIFENNKSKLSTQKAKLLATTLADFISLIPIKIYIISVDKSEFKKALGVKSLEDFKGSAERKDMKEYPYRIMSSLIFHWFEENQHPPGVIALHLFLFYFSLPFFPPRIRFMIYSPKGTSYFVAADTEWDKY